MIPKVVHLAVPSKTPSTLKSACHLYIIRVTGRRTRPSDLDGLAVTCSRCLLAKTRRRTDRT